MKTSQSLARELVIENSGQTFSSAEDFQQWLEGAAVRKLKEMEEQTVKRCAEVALDTTNSMAMWVTKNEFLAAESMKRSVADEIDYLLPTQD